MEVGKLVLMLVIITVLAEAVTSPIEADLEEDMNDVKVKRDLTDVEVRMIKKGTSILTIITSNWQTPYTQDSPCS